MEKTYFSQGEKLLEVTLIDNQFLNLKVWINSNDYIFRYFIYIKWC